nr:S9 family peptidase [Verrucomicrobiota bacterium]
MRALLLTAALTVSASLPSTAQPQAAADRSPVTPTPAAPIDDPYLWLEEMRGERAMAWVLEQNGRSLAVLERDPRYEGYFDEALRIVEASDRIPAPEFRGGHIDNFWRDARHPQGIWRRTSLESYRTAEPRWEILLDLDQLSRTEKVNWVWAGADSLRPAHDRCLVTITRGGQDASVIREFDLISRRIVEGGFRLEESKQAAVWVDRDTLLAGRDWGNGAMTASGYPFILKRIVRGRPADQAQEVFRGRASDMAVWPAALRDPDGSLRGLLAIRRVSFFEGEHHLLDDRGPFLIPV